MSPPIHLSWVISVLSMVCFLNHSTMAAAGGAAILVAVQQCSSGGTPRASRRRQGRCRSLDAAEAAETFGGGEGLALTKGLCFKPLTMMRNLRQLQTETAG